VSMAWTAECSIDVRACWGPVACVLGGRWKPSILFAVVCGRRAAGDATARKPEALVWRSEFLIWFPAPTACSDSELPSPIYILYALCWSLLSDCQSVSSLTVGWEAG